jgi:hypothetical protein
MITPTFPASVHPVKENSRCNSNLPKKNPTRRRLNTNRSCGKCGYALYPNTGRCTSCECPRYVRKSGGAMTGGELMYEYAPPKLFHGRKWGSWTLDAERLVLAFDGQPAKRGDGSGVTQGVPQYLVFLGRYEVDLEQITDCASLSDWIFQVQGKSWATAKVTKDFLNALNSILHPQKYFCSGACRGGGGKTILNPGEFLRKRIATVGVGDRSMKGAA